MDSTGKMENLKGVIWHAIANDMECGGIFLDDSTVDGITEEVIAFIIDKIAKRKNSGCDRCGVNDREIGKFCYKCHGEMLKILKGRSNV